MYYQLDQTASHNICISVSVTKIYDPDIMISDQIKSDSEKQRQYRMLQLQHTHAPRCPCLNTDPKLWQEFFQVVTCIWDVCRSRQFGQLSKLNLTNICPNKKIDLAIFFYRFAQVVTWIFTRDVWDVCQSRQFVSFPIWT